MLARPAATAVQRLRRKRHLSSRQVHLLVSRVLREVLARTPSEGLRLVRWWKRVLPSLLHTQLSCLCGEAYVTFSRATFWACIDIASFQCAFRLVLFSTSSPWHHAAAQQSSSGGENWFAAHAPWNKGRSFQQTAAELVRTRPPDKPLPRLRRGRHLRSRAGALPMPALRWAWCVSAPAATVEMPPLPTRARRD